MLLGRVSAEDCDRLRAVSAGHPGHGGPGGVYSDEGAVHEVRGGVHHMLQHHREVGDQVVFSREKKKQLKNLQSMVSCPVITQVEIHRLSFKCLSL